MCIKFKSRVFFCFLFLLSYSYALTGDTLEVINHIAPLKENHLLISGRSFKLSNIKVEDLKEYSKGELIQLRILGSTEYKDIYAAFELLLRQGFYKISLESSDQAFVHSVDLQLSGMQKKMASALKFQLVVMLYDKEVKIWKKGKSLLILKWGKPNFKLKSQLLTLKSEAQIYIDSDQAVLLISPKQQFSDIQDLLLILRKSFRTIYFSKLK